MTGLPIDMLLCEDPIDWIEVKNRAKKHPKSISKNFIHKLCLEPSVPPPFLDWALTLSHAPFQLLHKSGLDFPGKTQESSAPLELCLRDTVPYYIFVRIVQATHEADPNYCPRFDIISRADMLKMDIDKLRKLLETYDTKHFEHAIEDFLLVPLVSQTCDWGEIEVEEEESRLELVLKAASRLWGCERTTSKGCFILPNTFLATVVPRYGSMYGKMYPSVWHYAMTSIIGNINPIGVSLVDDQEGNTLLHYIMEYAAKYINIL